MAKHEAIDGVVVRVKDTGDHGRYLSILTADRGRISMLAHGSRSVHSQQVAISQLYTYGNYEFYTKGSANILKGGSTVHVFHELSTDIDRMNLAAYLCDVICEFTDEGVEAEDFLRLLLNSFHAVSRELRPMEQIKGAFELRAAAMSGYLPDLTGCALCGKPHADPFYLDVMNGAILCGECRGKAQEPPRVGAYADELREARILGILSPSVCAAFRYCLSAPLSRLFSFELKDENELRDFGRLAETYLLSHVGHGFESLNFYRSMLA